MTFLSENEHPELPALLENLRKRNMEKVNMPKLPATAIRETYTIKNYTKRECSRSEIRREYASCLTRPAITEILKLYRSNECLWNRQSTHYNNRKLRSLAYEQMTKTCQKYNPNADCDWFKQFIENMRTTYSRELKKVLRTAEAAKDEEGAIYVPKLWYFDLMTFLHEKQYPHLSALMTSLRNQDKDALSTIYLPDWSYEDVEQQDVSARSHDALADPAVMVDSSRLDLDAMHVKALEEMSDDSDCPRSKEYADNRSVPRPTVNARDQFDVFGENVAHKLRSVKRMQRLLAEKIINEVLFYAELDRLDVNSALIGSKPDD